MTVLESKNALITGSSRGVGQQVAKGLAELGCNIIVHGRSLQSCEDTLKMLESYPVRTFAVYGDLSDESQVEELVNQVAEIPVLVDILYNNAAGMTPYQKDFWKHEWESWIQTYRVNVIAMYHLCAAFIPGMVDRGFGRVVNLTSGIMNEPELAPYGASKWAVNKLTNDLASGIEGSGVRINAMDPGWLQTDMGGQNAHHPVEAVLPGALDPVLIDDDGPNGRIYSAIDRIWG